MSTITTMSGDGPSAPSTAPATEAAPDADRSPAAATRTLAIPLPTAIVGALITAMFGLLFFSLNGLRSDIDALRVEITGLRSDTDRRFAEVNAVLLDHTDRLARIETHLDIRPAADVANP